MQQILQLALVALVLAACPSALGARELFASNKLGLCSRNAQCRGSKAGPYCVAKKCVQCTTHAQCSRTSGGALNFCVANKCASRPPRCRRDADCGAGRVCALASGACVQCVSSSQCGPGTQCTRGQCLPQASQLEGAGSNSSVPLQNSTDASSNSTSGGNGTSSGNATEPLPAPGSSSDNSSGNNSSGSNVTSASTEPGTPARECNSNADCPRSMLFDLTRGPQCSPEGKCVQCNADADCPAAGLACVGKCDVCVAHECLACRADADCAGATGLEGQGPYCSAGQCLAKAKRGCSSDDECAVAFPTCLSPPCPAPKCVDSVCDSGLDGLGLGLGLRR